MLNLLNEANICELLKFKSFVFVYIVYFHNLKSLFISKIKITITVFKIKLLNINYFTYFKILNWLFIFFFFDNNDYLQYRRILIL